VSYKSEDYDTQIVLTGNRKFDDEAMCSSVFVIVLAILLLKLILLVLYNSICFVIVET
jgi:hypothetical protein